MLRALARRALAPLAATAALLLAASPAHAAPPPNDSFANAEMLAGPAFSATGSTAEATLEPGERNHAGTSRGYSVWYTWTAPASGTVVLDTVGSGFPTTLAVYTGDAVNALTDVTSGGAGNDDRSRVRFSATAGTAYRIAVDVDYGTPGALKLNLAMGTPPANDMFAAPVDLTGTDAQASADTTWGTRERGEPYPGYGGGSVWFTWTAPADGAVAVDTAGSDFDTVVAVYTGPAVNQLAWVAGNDNDPAGGTKTSRAQFRAVAGTTYRIVVDGRYLGQLGQARLALSLRPPPPNDAFASAIELPGERSTSVTGNSAGGTVETGEPRHYPYEYNRSSVWYSWTAPSDGSLTIKATPSGFQPVLAAYTGDTLVGLQRVTNQAQDWNGGPEQIRIRVEAGVTYRIAVDTTGFGGPFVLSLDLVDLPLNDDFEDALPIVGPVAELVGNSVGATQQPCEPVHDDNYYDPSVWFEWTAPVSGAVTIDTGGSDFPVALGLYTGDALCSLTRVAATRHTPAGVSAKRSFRVQAGVKYRIAVDGQRARTGNYKLSLRTYQPPANDLFAEAEQLTGATVSAAGTTVGATIETGEPFASTTVWYSWTAPANGKVNLSLPSKAPDTRVSVYTGTSVGSLSSVTSYGEEGFTGTAGTTYRIRVDGGTNPSQPFTLALDQPPPPKNDDFANAEVLAGEDAKTSGDTTNATVEPNEPRPTYTYGYHSVWYAWTAPSDGTLKLTTTSSWRTAIGVYMGGSVNALTHVASSDGWSYSSNRNLLTVKVKAGVTYRVVVNGDYSQDRGPFELSVAHRNRPANDNFAAATELPGEAAVRVAGHNVDATAETGEPGHRPYYYNANASVWYRWTAPESGSLVIKTEASFQTIIAAYTGGSVGALTRVANQPQAWDGGVEQIRIRVHRGATYMLAVDSPSYGTTGDFALSLELSPSPSNDDFANAAPLSGPVVEVLSSNEGATQEPCEPVHDQNQYDPSVWYEWTAPANGAVRADTSGSDFPTILGIYTGDDLCKLTRPPVARLSTAAGEPARRGWRVVAGERYKIAVDGWGARMGDFRLSLRFEPPPANDHFEDAQNIGSGPVEGVPGTNLGATTQPGEDDPGYARGASVWYRWTAASTGLVKVHLPKSTASFGLRAYTGDSFDSRKFVAARYYGNAMYFRAVAGTEYRVAVDGGYNVALGDFTLRIDTPPPPANDDFANAAAIGPADGSVDGTTAGATGEPGEPAAYYYSRRASVWYTWTAPADGLAVWKLSVASGSNSDHTITASTGDSISTLKQVASDHGRLRFRAVAGTTYRIAVASEESDMKGAFKLEWQNIGPPPNDAFAAAADMGSGSAWSAKGTTVGGTSEAGEPRPVGYAGYATVWYRWTAPATGSTAVFATGYKATSVFTGDAVDSLTAVEKGEGGWFRAVAGRTYHIRVEGQLLEPTQGDFEVSLKHVAPPPNDDLSAAVTLAGDSPTAQGTLVGATPEDGEPKHDGGSAGHGSVWYSWTASSTGTAEVALTSNATGALAAYTGDRVDALVRASAPGRPLRFRAVAGTTYRIAVYGHQRDSNGDFSIGIKTGPGPAHDNIADAIVLAGSSDSRTDPAHNATPEAGEPRHSYGPERSVWYRWTAPSNGRVTFEAKNNAGDRAGVAIYSGGPAYPSLGKLTDAYGYPTARASALVRGGQTYYLAVDATVAPAGTITASVSHAPAPPNDDFAAAAQLSDSYATAAVSIDNASRETGEPTNQYGYYNYGYTCHGCPTVWWRWTAPDTRMYSLDLAGMNFNANPGVFTGSKVDALTRVASGYHSPLTKTTPLTFKATAGTTYSFSVEVAPGQVGEVRLALAPVDPPANDHLANAEEVPGQKGERRGQTASATKEADEPSDGAGAGASVWYRWTAPESGYVGFGAEAQWNRYINAYTGSTYDDLEPVARGTAVQWYATKGTTYRIRVDGLQAKDRGSLNLVWGQQTAPANDHFVNALAVSGSSVAHDGTTTGASPELGEPRHARYTAGRSVWYRWVAPSDGPVAISAGTSWSDSVLGVYTGSSVSSLTEVASNDDNGKDRGSSVVFEADGGTEYRIAVDSKSWEQIWFKFTIEHWPSAPPPGPLPVQQAAPEETTAPEDTTATGDGPGSDDPPAGDPLPAEDPPAGDPPSGDTTEAGEADPAQDPPAGDPPAQDPPAQDPPVEEPPAEDPPAENPPAGNQSAEDPPAQDPPAQDPPTDDPPADDPPTDDPPADDPAAQDPPAEGSQTPPFEITPPDEGLTEPPADEGSADPPAEDPPAEEPPADDPPTEDQPIWDPVPDDPPAEDPPADDPASQDPAPQDPPAQDPPAQDPPAQDPPTQDLPAEDPPAQDPPAAQGPAAQGPAAQDPPAQDPPAQDPPARPAPPLDQPPAGNTDPPPADESARLVLTASHPKQKLAAVLSKGLTTSVTCSLACELELTVTIDAPTAKKLGLRSSKLTTLRASGRAAAGRATKLVVKVPKPLQAKLKKARSLPLTVAIGATSATAPRAADTRRIVVKR